MIDTNPDMYGVRRSARSRKEPERYTTNDGESDDSDSNRKSTRKSRRKTYVLNTKECSFC